MRRAPSRPSPLISIITPVFDTPVSRLEEAVQSILTQTYENWELLLIDDESTDPHLLRMPCLTSRGATTEYVLAKPGKTTEVSLPRRIAGLELARGEWVTFLDHDDVLEPNALFQIVNALQTDPDARSDLQRRRQAREDGFEAPLFKPNWSPDFFLPYNLRWSLDRSASRSRAIEPAGLVRSSIAHRITICFLRVTERTSRIHHIPRVLYHWRRSESSSAISVRQKPEQLDASRRAIEDHLKRRGEAAHVAVDWRTHAFRVRRELLGTDKNFRYHSEFSR